jgi:hypothetical protein
MTKAKTTPEPADIYRHPLTDEQLCEHYLYEIGRREFPGHAASMLTTLGVKTTRGAAVAYVDDEVAVETITRRLDRRLRVANWELIDPAEDGRRYRMDEVVRRLVPNPADQVKVFKSMGRFKTRARSLLLRRDRVRPSR